MEYQLTEKDKEWIQYLKDNPDKQCSGFLGTIKDGELVEACCLGVLVWLHADKKLPDGEISTHVEGKKPRISKNVVENYEELNLCDTVGSFKNTLYLDFPDGSIHHSLASANDKGVSWADIAKAIEENPDQIFRKWDTN